MSTEPGKPLTLVRESDQAAWIIRGFCGDGFFDQDDRNSVSTSREQSSEGGGEIDRAVRKTIPAAVIRRAKGNGTVLIERIEENEQFYGRKALIHEIPSRTLAALQRTLQAAQDDGEGGHHSFPPGEPPS